MELHLIPHGKLCNMFGTPYPDQPIMNCTLPSPHDTRPITSSVSHRMHYSFEHSAVGAWVVRIREPTPLGARTQLIKHVCHHRHHHPHALTHQSSCHPSLHSISFTSPSSSSSSPLPLPSLHRHHHDDDDDALTLGAASRGSHRRGGFLLAASAAAAAPQTQTHPHNRMHHTAQNTQHTAHNTQPQNTAQNITPSPTQHG